MTPLSGNDGRYLIIWGYINLLPTSSLWYRTHDVFCPGFSPSHIMADIDGTRPYLYSKQCHVYISHMYLCIQFMSNCKDQSQLNFFYDLMYVSNGVVYPFPFIHPHCTLLGYVWPVGISFSCLVSPERMASEACGKLAAAYFESCTVCDISLKDDCKLEEPFLLSHRLMYNSPLAKD